jgi:hypothetical protein
MKVLSLKERNDNENLFKVEEGGENIGHNMYK